MMYVDTRQDVREFILDGASASRSESQSAQDERARAEIQMPAYRDRVSAREVEDLVDTFLVLSGMARPMADSAPRRGYDLARRWQCFSCHGPGGSGGLANPGSFTGFVPGWYGSDFDDLVRSDEELTEWLRTGRLSRLEGNPLAAWFTRRQELQMPAYEALSDGEIQDLRAYFEWLKDSGGGVSGVS